MGIHYNVAPSSGSSDDVAAKEKLVVNRILPVSFRTRSSTFRGSMRGTVASEALTRVFGGENSKESFPWRKCNAQANAFAKHGSIDSNFFAIYTPPTQSVPWFPGNLVSYNTNITLKYYERGDD